MQNQTCTICGLEDLTDNNLKELSSIFASYLKLTSILLRFLLSNYINS